MNAVILLAILSWPARVFAQSAELDRLSAMIQQGKFQEAQLPLEKYLQTHPRSLRASNLLGDVYLREGKLEKAEAVLQKAAALAPTAMEPRINLGAAYFAAGDLEAALVAYAQAARIAPADPRVNLALAKLYLRRGEFAKSIEASGRIPSSKRPPELLPTLAADYFGLQQPEKAGVEIQAMLQFAVQQPDLVPELLEFFLAHRDFNSSQQLLDLARDKQPVTDRLQVDLALTQAGLGQLDAAQGTLESVLEHKPDSLEALTAAGHVATQQLNWAAAVEAFSRAASLAPDRPDILYGLASAQLYGAQNGPALETAQKLHSLAPDDLRSSYVLALALFGSNQWEEAKRYAYLVLNQHPDNREMLLILADVAMNIEHDATGAERYAELCLEQNPKDSGALYYRGMAQKMEGNLKGAIQSLSESVAANPKSADAQSALGALYIQTGDVADAVGALEQAVGLAPDEPQNHYQLALAYSRSGALDKAKTQLELYQHLKAKEAKEAKELKGPSTSEVPHMGIAAHP